MRPAWLFGLLLAASPGEAVVARVPPLHPPGAIVRVPESAGTLRMMRGALDGLAAAPDPGLARVYAELAPQIASARALAEKAESSGYEQEKTALAVEAYNRVLSAPIALLHLGESRAGARGERVKDWEREGLERVQKALAARGEDLWALLPGFAAGTLEVLEPPARARPGLPYQPRFLYKDGLLPPMRFVEARETGDFLIGVARRGRADYDGQPGTARGFTGHDFGHARTQMDADLELFRELGVRGFEEARELKALNDAAVRELLAEWRLIPDPALKARVEGALFALLHEESQSYPIQVDAALRPERRDLAELTLRTALNAPELVGRRVFKASAADPKAAGREAYEWIAPRAARHAERVRSEFEASKKASMSR